MSNPTEQTTPMNAQQLLERVKTESGPKYWRSLDELAATPEFQARMRKEFSSQTEQWIDPVTRRNFLKVMGASLALSGLTACNLRRPNEPLVPYVEQPENMVLGKPLFFASAMPYLGYAFPLLVESREGRPIKVEGNPDHPASLGATLPWVQASILSLYDPDRAQVIMKKGAIRSWADFVLELQTAAGELSSAGGEGIAVLTTTVTSPTLADQIKRVQEKLPKLRWVQYDPAANHNARTAAIQAFGEAVETQYVFEKADVVVSLDSDFMMDGPDAVSNSKQFSNRRRVRTVEDNMVRLYAVESSPTNTGTLADHRVPLRPTQIPEFARALAAELGVQGASAPAASEWSAKVFSALVKDLQAHKGRSIVVAGNSQPPVVHVLAHAINAALGNVGQTVLYSQPAEVSPTDQIADLKALVQEMNAGKVKALLVLGGNPVYNTPADLDFLTAYKKVPFSAHLSDYVDETSAQSIWQIPAAHYLESWGDARAHNGLVSIIQPLIAPLYPLVKSPLEMLAALLGESSVVPYEVVRAHWQQERQGEDFEQFWRRALHDGFVAATQAQPKQVTVKPEAISGGAQAAPAASGLDVVFRLDPTVRDGSFANLGWLQELPKPFTKLTWENAFLLSVQTAAKLGLTRENETQFEQIPVVTLTYNGRQVSGPVLIVPGHANDTVTVHLGYGRTRAGRVGGSEESPLGFNGYQLLTTDALGVGTGGELKKTGKTQQVAQTQLHFALDQPDIPGVLGGIGKELGNHLDMTDRGIVRSATLAEYRKEPGFVNHQGPHLPENADQMSFYRGSWEYKGYAWGMAIDMNVCNGCNACVVACQAENNIPVVGKEQVLKQREMHWLRIDQYYTGNPENPELFNQPLPCMHCENAPCEVVCPVLATVHSDEGTNDMIYNRCVGTRFCSNNCPYKVRRFNYHLFADFNDPLKKMLYNPDVTVRSRGVMEKCTFCIQRIQAGRIDAEVDGRKVRDGEIQTACQSTCPTDAIVFGNINDETSRVAQLKANSLNYSLLADLNTKPRVTYLAVLKNPNPELEA